MRRNPDRSGARRGCVRALLVLALAALGEAPGSARDTPCPAHLFHIERNKNANIVVYDANRGPTGDLDPTEPVKVYWLLNGQPDQREDLNVIERDRAYGFDVTPGKKPGTYTMVFKAGRRRQLTVRMLKGCPVVIGPIGGHQGILRKMFIQSKDGLVKPKVEYIEFFGEDSTTGAKLYEKYVPKN